MGRKNLLNSNNCREIGGGFLSAAMASERSGNTLIFGSIVAIAAMRIPRGTDNLLYFLLYFACKKKITKSLPRFLPISVLPNGNKHFEGGTRGHFYVRFEELLSRGCAVAARAFWGHIFTALKNSKITCLHSQPWTHRVIVLIGL